MCRVEETFARTFDDWLGFLSEASMVQTISDLDPPSIQTIPYLQFPMSQTACYLGSTLFQAVSYL